MRMSSVYPLKFKPIYKERVWGGRQLHQLFERNFAGAHIGESWEVCSSPYGMSVVANGIWQGMTLAQLLHNYPQTIMGETFTSVQQFPLLVKFIDATAKLSIQVHPDDSYARTVEQGMGKEEGWYVVAAKPNAKIVYGLNEHITQQEFVAALQGDYLLDCLRFVAVNTGDMIYIPSGLVHAICEGIVVYEVQQNSDITYRIYDYGRVGMNGKARETQVDKALDVIKFGVSSTTEFHRSVINGSYFSMSKHQIDGALMEPDFGNLRIYCAVEGHGYMRYHTGEIALNPGDNLLVPAALPQVEFYGKLTLVKTTITGHSA